MYSGCLDSLKPTHAISFRFINNAVLNNKSLLSKNLINKSKFNILEENANGSLHEFE